MASQRHWKPLSEITPTEVGESCPPKLLTQITRMLAALRDVCPEPYCDKRPKSGWVFTNKALLDAGGPKTVLTIKPNSKTIWFTFKSNEEEPFIPAKISVFHTRLKAHYRQLLRVEGSVHSASSYVVVKWTDEYVEDLIPSSWFADLSPLFGASHKMKGGGKAWCDVSKDGLHATLDYRPYPQFNQPRKVEPGVMRITFTDETLTKPVTVEWEPGTFARKASSIPPVAPSPEPRFKPEFGCKGASYVHRDPVEADCEHGRVINALADVLGKRGLKFGNDKPRDLYAADGLGHMTVLFEAKTDLSTTSLYQAIGQLIYHSHGHESRPRLVMVLPAQPDAKTSAVLSGLGVETVTYRVVGPRVSFTGLDTVLPRA